MRGPDIRPKATTNSAWNDEIHIFESRRFPMKTVYKFAVLMLTMFAATVCGFAQVGPKVAAPLNLERGVTGPVTTNLNWTGFSALNLIPGAGLIPITSKTTAFYLGFTAGSTADISNMVLYTTPRNSSTISAVTPVTYGGVPNPSINLASKTVCVVQPLSAGSPCIVRLDPMTLSLSALSDYYLVVYFTANDNNNSAVSATVGGNVISSLTGWFLSSDQTRFTVGQSIPAGSNGGRPNFLMYVKTN
jgi:hypothetical protein